MKRKEKKKKSDDELNETPRTKNYILDQKKKTNEMKQKNIIDKKKEKNLM